MASSGSGGRIPCVEQPELEAFDTDGDGILSMQELRTMFPEHEQLQQVVTALESHDVAGIRYAGCGEGNDAGSSTGSNGAGEDLATLIARAAVAQYYANRER